MQSYYGEHFTLSAFKFKNYTIKLQIINMKGEMFDMAGSTKIVKRELADQINELLELIESGNVGGGNSKLQVHTQDLIVGVAGQTEFPITLETFDPAIDTVIVQKGMLLLNPKGDYTISDKKVVLTEPVVDGQTIGIWVWQNVPRTEGESYISGALLTDGSISMDKIDAAFAAELDEVKKSVSDGKAAVANAITNKGVETATDATFETMATNIANIPVLDTSDANATAEDILVGKSGYVNGEKVEGSIESLAAQTITPGASNQIIAAGKYLSGDQTIKGDANLIAANIMSGVKIFGITGTAELQPKTATKSVTISNINTLSVSTGLSAYNRSTIYAISVTGTCVVKPSSGYSGGSSTVTFLGTEVAFSGTSIQYTNVRTSNGYTAYVRYDRDSDTATLTSPHGRISETNVTVTLYYTT